MPEELQHDKEATLAMLQLENMEDGGGKPKAMEAAVQFANEEQVSNKELADILMEEYGGDKEESKEVETDKEQAQQMEAEAEKEEDESSTEVEDDEVKDEATDALLSSNRKDKRDLAHGNIDKHAKKL